MSFFIFLLPVLLYQQICRNTYVEPKFLKNFAQLNGFCTSVDATMYSASMEDLLTLNVNPCLNLEHTNRKPFFVKCQV